MNVTTSLSTTIKNREKQILAAVTVAGAVAGFLGYGLADLIGLAVDKTGEVSILAGAAAAWVRSMVEEFLDRKQAVIDTVNATVENAEQALDAKLTEYETKANNYVSDASQILIEVKQAAGRGEVFGSMAERVS